MNRSSKLPGPSGAKPAPLLVPGGTAEEVAEKVGITAAAPNSPWCKSGFVGRKVVGYSQGLFVDFGHGDG